MMPLINKKASCSINIPAKFIQKNTKHYITSEHIKANDSHNASRCTVFPKYGMMSQ